MQRIILMFAATLAAASTASASSAASTATTMTMSGSNTMTINGAFTRVHHPVTTSSPRAQAYFDQGLTLLYAYNRGAARHAFEQAAKADPNLAMAQWGIAISLGSNINVTVDPKGERDAYAAIQRARALTQNASPIERAYITALATRYSNAPKPNLAALATAYNKAMAKLKDQYPDDVDAATLYVESGMELHPWALYTTDGTPIAGTQELVATLESILRRAPQAIGANHFYIHAVEASRHPERALISAMRLDAMTFEPGAAHIVHMPAHVYMRTGDFNAAARSNEHATAHDRAFLHAEPDPEASAYYGHNLNMLATGYGMQGNWSGAQRATDLLAGQGSYLYQLFILMRFQRWDDLIAKNEPSASVDGPMVVPMFHFARGLAYAATNNLAQAQQERAVIEAARAALHIPSSAGNYNSSNDMLGLAEHMLAARIAQSQNDAAGEIAQLEQAVTVHDRFLYVEPPDWYRPSREALGGALLRAGRYADAESVFRADLQHNMRNPRSLFGLAAALRGEGRYDDAAFVQAQFDDAWRNADTKLTVADL
jgi:hypothetical protein